MSTEETKRRLISLGSELLAEALLALAEANKDASHLVTRLTATPQEKLKQFKAKLAGLRRSKKHVWVRESPNVAAELHAALDLLAGAQPTPLDGVRAMASFFEIDASVFNRCDDSHGIIGGVFKSDATNLFVQFAAQCEQKPTVAEILFELMLENDFGARDHLPEQVAEFLPGDLIRTMIARSRQLALDQTDQYKRRALFSNAAMYARELKDPELFLELTQEITPVLWPPHLLKIAQVFLESGVPEKALLWIQKIEDQSGHSTFLKEKLLLEIHSALGNTEDLQTLAWQAFHRDRTLDALERLLTLIGGERRESVICEEVAAIIKEPELSRASVQFLLDTEHTEAAGDYLLARREQLERFDYSQLLSVAKLLEAREKPLAASVLYRRFMEAILEKPIFEAYGHAARYLLTLESLSLQIHNWAGVEPHEPYAARVRFRHARKTAFWARYNAAAQKLAH